MTSEKYPLVASNDASFYTGREVSASENGTGNISRLILHGLTVISVLVACGCAAYGASRDKSFILILPVIVVFVWLVIHCLLFVFARRHEHDFHPPAWFFFISSGHIVLQALIATILVLTG